MGDRERAGDTGTGGQATHTGDLMGKRLQLLKEAAPKVSRMAILRLAGPVQDLFVKDLETAARQADGGADSRYRVTTTD
jgi:hypothetical protein